MNNERVEELERVEITTTCDVLAELSPPRGADDSEIMSRPVVLSEGLVFGRLPQGLGQDLLSAYGLAAR